MSNKIKSAVPPYTSEEARARETFEALMWAFSYPGRTQKLPDDPNRIALIGDSLLDLETTFFTTDKPLIELLKRTAARLMSPERAAYHFYPTVNAEALTALELAPVGTPQYPDEGATLVLGCTFGIGQQLTLRGPGIRGLQTIYISGIPEAFWQLRAKTGIYPLGWDIFLVDPVGQLIGLPRTTHVREFEV